MGKFPKGTLERAWEEAESNAVKLSHGREYVKPWRDWERTEDGDEATIFIGGRVANGLQSTTARLAKESGTPWQNRITLSSFLNLANFEPMDYIRRIKVPTFYAIQIDGGLQQPHEVHYKAIAQFPNSPEVYKIPMPPSETAGEQNRLGFAQSMIWLQGLWGDRT